MIYSAYSYASSVNDRLRTRIFSGLTISVAYNILLEVVSFAVGIIVGT